jgi:3-polyprenyl-4-hydroxybenzoate decarboxylase
MTKFASLRDYLAELDRLGDLQHVTQKIDWNLEAAAAIRYSTEHHRLTEAQAIVVLSRPLLAFTPSTGAR